MKRMIVVLVALVVLAGAALGLSWRGSFYIAAGTSDDGVGLGGEAENITVYAPDANVAVVYFADGDTISPADDEPGESNAFLTYPAGVVANETAIRADSLYVDRTVSTEVFIYWR